MTDYEEKIINALLDGIEKRDQKIKELEGKLKSMYQALERACQEWSEDLQEKDQSEVEKITERFLKEYREALEKLANK